MTDKTFCKDCEEGLAKGATCYIAAGVCPNKECETPGCGKCGGTWDYDCASMVEKLNRQEGK